MLHIRKGYIDLFAHHSTVVGIVAEQGHTQAFFAVLILFCHNPANFTAAEW